MSILKRIYTLIGAILIGLLASIWIIQSNTQLEVVLTKKLISKLENMWGIKIDVKSSRINFFTFSIFVKDGRIVDPKKDNCNWRFKQCKIHVSPLKLILNKKINLYLSFDDVAATTRFSNNNLDIVDHIAAMFAGGLDGLKIAPKVIQINNLDAEIVRDLHKIHILAAGRFRAEKISKHSKKPYSWHANFSVGDAQISLDDNVVAQDILLKGDLWRDKNTKNWNAKFGGQIKNFAPMPKKICNLEGEWNENKRQILIRSLDRSLNISVSDVVNILQIRGDFKLPDFVNTFNYLTKLPKEFTFSSGIAGNCNINAEYCLDSLMLQQGSNLAISNASYKGVGCDKIECKFLKNSSNKITSKISTTIRKGLDFEGICSWDWESGLGTSKFINTSTVKLFKNAIVKIGFSDYVVNPKNFMITAKINKELALDGLYKFNLVDQKTDEVRRFAGIYTFKNQELDISGSAGPGEYILKAQTSPSIHLSKVKYDNKKNVLIDFETQNKEDFVLKGDLEYSFIKSFFNPTIKNLFLGRDCVFGIEIDQHDLNKIQGLVKLVKGRFYIPESQNLVQEAQTGFEFVPPNKLCLTDAKIGCFKGEVFSPRITLVLDKFSGISFLHMPLQINDLLVNYKHDLLSVIYGNILIKKNVELDYKAFGQIVLKKTLLKENVFAAADKNNFYSQWSNFLPSCKDFEFDFKFISEQPIRAKTPTLETNASLNLRVNYSKSSSVINIPQLTGNIKLDGGFLRFLQNKLRIDYGKIEFVANQMNDPIIDLIAKNRINKYMVSLQASGSLQKPTILVESTPELTEEQVLSLLLSGSENYKLQTDLLALIEQNLYNIVLGSKTTFSQSANLLQKITRPLKYIQISPDFTDQSGRGGIKGTINVNVNDQVKAQLQKNFNLQDDFSVQLEYLLSDDVNVRAIKDQRGELGAEVELRLKF